MPDDPPAYRSVILDYDSTLVPVESLEELLLGPDGEPALRTRLEAITRAGMEGRLAFRDSLAQRLALAQPTRQAAVALGERLAARLTPGAAAACAAWTERGIEPWIVSGGLREVLLPAGRRLGIPPGRVCGVQLLWNDDGSFGGLDPHDAFTRSKVDGVRALDVRPPRPAIGVGDGATDRALLEAGLTDGFIVFTGHVRRAPVLAHGDPEARDFGAVRRLVETGTP